MRETIKNYSTVGSVPLYIKMNSTEVENPQCKLDDKCLCLLYAFGSVLTCAKSAHVLQKLSYFADIPTSLNLSN